MKTKNLLTLAIVGTLLFGVTTAASDFMHYETVDGIGTITICDFNDSSKCITMMDMNLGASKSGTTCSSADTGACGYHYQWGNNYGFEMGCLTHQCSDSITSNAITGTISTDGYGPQNYFNSGIFRKTTNSPYDWSSVRNDNLWGGGGDGQLNNQGYPMENPTDRKGPCDVGYHVPSAGEWTKLLEYWASNYKGVGNNFSSFINNSTAVTQILSDLKIPFAGYRFDTSANVFFSGRTQFWSSTPFYRAGRGSFTKPGNFAYYVYIASDSLEINTQSRAYGLSIRCFKDSYLSFPLVSITNDSTTTTVGGNEPVTGLPTTMTVTQNTISTVEGKEVLGEVNVDFGSNQTATFSHPVQVKIPVSDHEQVIVKVKHGGDSEYSFAGLTRNSSANCNNGEPTSSQYNGETINVVDGYATIYSCAASSFIALGVENDGNSKIVVSIAALNSGQNTCSGEDFIFPAITAKPSQQVITLAKKFQCVFGNSASKAVTLALSGDLTDGNGNVISGENVKLSNPEWTVQPAGLKNGNTVFSKQTFLGQGKTLFNKTGNKIGTAEGSGVEIEITVPGGTPDGTYNGTLVLTY